MTMIGFRAPNETLWIPYGAVVGNTRRSTDLRRFVEWRPENHELVLVADPNPTGSPTIHKFLVPDEVAAIYQGLFADNNRRMSADLRSYIAWRIANPTRPLPGLGRASVVQNQPPA